MVPIPKLVKNQIFVIPGDLNINTGDLIAVKTKEAEVSDFTNDVIGMSLAFKFSDYVYAC